MRTSRSQVASNSRRVSGFSILEILVAITVLVIGLSSMAVLVALTLTGTDRARYLSTATTLASEKLEDLNHWPSGGTNSNILAGGSLTSDTGVGSIDYFDDVDLSNATGQVAESIATTSGGSPTYFPVIHNATGYVDTTPDTAPPSSSGDIVFHRRWLIEAAPVVNGNTLTGVERVTVLVTLTNQAVQPPITFQMSMMRAQ